MSLESVGPSNQPPEFPLNEGIQLTSLQQTFTSFIKKTLSDNFSENFPKMKVDLIFILDVYKSYMVQHPSFKSQNVTNLEGVLNGSKTLTLNLFEEINSQSVKDFSSTISSNDLCYAISSMFRNWGNELGSEFNQKGLSALSGLVNLWTNIADLFPECPDFQRLIGLASNVLKKGIDDFQNASPEERNNIVVNVNKILDEAATVFTKNYLVAA